MPPRPRLTDITAQARFVFKGTVRRLRATTMRDEPASDRTIVVRVDEIVHAPEPLVDYLGQDITVLLSGRKTVKPGQQLVFYANGGVFGDSVAVRSLDHRRPEAVPAAMAAAAAGSPVQNLATRDAHARFQQADLVVSGRVRSVSVSAHVEAPALGLAAAVTAAGGTTITRPISEHDPLMHEAMIDIAAAHKGSHRGDTVTVQFPSSTDVKWYGAPKFRVGQEGFFMLHRDEASKSARPEMAAAAVAASPEVPEGAYTALHPADFQPFDQPGGIRTVIPASPTTPPLLQ